MQILLRHFRKHLSAMISESFHKGLRGFAWLGLAGLAGRKESVDGRGDESIS